MFHESYAVPAEVQVLQEGYNKTRRLKYILVEQKKCTTFIVVLPDPVARVVQLVTSKPSCVGT